MKKGLISFLIVFLILITTGCSQTNIKILGNGTVELGETINLFTDYRGDDKIIWSDSNEYLIKVKDGTYKAIKAGKTNISITVGKKTVYKEINIELPNVVITINGVNKLEVNKQYLFTYQLSKEFSEKVIWSSSDESIASIDQNGLVLGLKPGKVKINAKLFENESSFELEIYEMPKFDIIVKNDNKVESGSTMKLNISTSSGIESNFEYSSSDEKIAVVSDEGIVTAISEGIVIITIRSIEYPYIFTNVEIEIYKIPDVDHNLERVNEILNNMTLSQKIGQMFVVGFNGTNISSSLTDAINEYNFGNVIYMAYNVSNPSTLVSMTNAIQNQMVTANTVPGFITTDQEGGRVARLTNGGTHFISQMALAATNDYNNAYLEGISIGEELLSYGINADFAPVLDVNNNPNNPIIGIRSYSDDPQIVGEYGVQMINGLKSANVLACAKHFPGHGNTSVDSHYGLPSITTPKEDLYKVELAPFIKAINSGVDAIMTTHIIFTAIDTVYPATLSEKVLTGLLRNELNYNGLIITDGMGMNAIDENFGTPDVTGVLAVKAGVDILTYTSINEPIIAHKAIKQAVLSGTISEERINESVRRILLTKLKYGILDNYLTTDINRENMLKEHQELNKTFAKQSLTKVFGEFNGLDKNKSTLIISPTSSFTLGSNLSSNSLGALAANYLKENGHTHVDYKTVATNISDTDANSILNNLNDYEQIVIALSNVYTSKYSRSAEFVKNLTTNHSNVIVIALDTPYDMLAYDNNVKNYICVYGYQKETALAICSYLNGEFTAIGKLPIDESKIKK